MQVGENLAHWGGDILPAMFQTTFSNAFSWMIIHEFWLRFHWILYGRVQLTIFHHWFRQWLGTDQATSHYLDQWWPCLLMHMYVTRPQWVKCTLNGDKDPGPALTHWPLGDLDAILKLQFLILCYWLVSSDLLMIMHPDGTPWDLKDDKSTLVQVMAWCLTAPSHYLSQCWPSSMSPYGVTRPQWVNIKTVFPGTGKPIIRIRQDKFWDCLIFIMGIPILRDDIFTLEQAPAIIPTPKKVEQIRPPPPQCFNAYNKFENYTLKITGIKFPQNWIMNDIICHQVMSRAFSVKLYWDGYQ